MRPTLLALVLLFSTVPLASAAVISTDSFHAALAGHGGLARWNRVAAIEFDVSGWPFSDKAPLQFHELADLRGGRSLIVADTYRIAFDGRRYWGTPELAAAGVSPRRLVSEPTLIVSMPFIFGGKGTVTRAGSQDHAWNVSLATAPGVRYTIHLSTSPARLLAVSISPAPGSGQYSLYGGPVTALFKEWQETSDLWLPKTVDFIAGTALTGKSLGTVTFQNIRLSDDPQEPELFALPAGAAVDDSK
jgi:hypothetical protein